LVIKKNVQYLILKRKEKHNTHNITTKSFMKNLQEKIIDVILSRFPKKSDAISGMSEVLGIGTDPIYRRVRGETPLTAEEIMLLSQKFNISLDALVYENTDTLVFSYNPFSQPVKTFEDYINQILENTLQASSLPDVHVYYAASDLPIFYYAFFPEIFMFKLYTWGKTVWDFEYLRDQPFSTDIISPHAVEMMKRVTSLYMQMETTELWNINIIDNTLGQIEYHFNSNGFKNGNDALLLLERLTELLKHIKRMATQGHKYTLGGIDNQAGKLHLYHNEMVITNNTIFMTSQLGMMLFSTLSYPNFIRSLDQRICEYQLNWFKLIIGKSNSIDLNNEKTREWFFNKLNHKIDLVRKRIEVRMMEDED
jgi:hypothetical protein